MTRIAIVGAGTMGTIHGESCRNLPDVTVTWVADRHAGRATALADALGARATTDNSAAVGADDVDAVIVAVPTPAHRAVTELAAGCGKDIFCEKPIARTVEDAEAIVLACRQAGVRLMVGHVVRFFPNYARIYDLLRQQAIGQVGVVRASRINAYPSVERSWYTDLAASGGPVIDLMIHDLDTLRWYFGEAERVFAHGLSFTPYQSMTDYALAVVRFANGVIAHVETSWAHTTFRTAIELYGSDGALRHASEESMAIRLERRAPVEQTAPVQAPSSPLAEGPYQTELRHFLEQRRDGSPFLVDGAEAIRSLDLALAVLTAIETGRPVTLHNGRFQAQELDS